MTHAFARRDKAVIDDWILTRYLITGVDDHHRVDNSIRITDRFERWSLIGNGVLDKIVLKRDFFVEHHLKLHILSHRYTR